MKFMKILLAMIFTLVLVSQVSAATVLPLPGWQFCPNGDWLDVRQTNYDGTYYVQSGDTLEIDMKLDIVCAFSVNTRADVYAQLMIDEDDLDYLTTRERTQELELDGLEIEKFKLKINVDEDTPADEYEVILRVWTEGDEYLEQEIPLTIIVNEYDEIDLKLTNTTFCTGEAPYETYLELINEGNDDYFIEIDLDSEELWPRTKDNFMYLESDEVYRAFVKFEKDVLPGEYTISVDTTAYESDDRSGNKINFQKDFVVTIEDCLMTNVSLNMLTSSIEAEPNKRSQAYFDFKNETDERMPVEFKVESNDSSIILSLDTRSKIVEADSYIRNTLYIQPTDSTSAGTKTVTLKAITPYNIIEKSFYVSVEEAKFDVDYNVVNTKVGLKAVQVLEIRNNGNSTLNLRFSAEGTDDYIYFENNSVKVNPNQTANVKVNIVPKTVGYKNYNLKITGDSHFEKELYYSVSGRSATPVFVETYNQKTNVLKNSNNYIPVVLSNPYEFDITLELSLDDVEGIVSVPETVELAAGETKAANLQYFVNEVSTGKYYANLVVDSELGSVKMPTVITVKTDLADILELRMVDLESEVNFVSGNETNLVWKIKNPNSIAINDAVIQVVKDGTVVATKVFSIDAYETLELETSMVIDSEEEFIGTVVLIAEDKENSYEVTFTPTSGFLTTGLFGLGLGSTLGIVLGVIIVALIIVLLLWNNKEDEVVLSDAEDKE